MSERQHTSPRRAAALLFSCVLAAQSGQLALTPVLTDAAHTFSLTTAEAGQIRTVAAAFAAVAALAAGAASARVSLRTLLSVGLALVFVGSSLSLTASSVPALAVGQSLTGAASSVVLAAGVAAAAAWSDDADRARVVAWTLVGAPAAWVVAMPLIGVVGTVSWRLAFAVPVAVAAATAVALRLAPAGRASQAGSGLRPMLSDRALRRWATGELLSYAAWSGVLVYAGALLVESYAASHTAVGVALGAGAAAYIPGTFAARRVAAERARALLATAGILLAVSVLGFGILRFGTTFSAVGFGVLCFLSGARTYLGSAAGLDLGRGEHASAMSLRAAAAQIGWIVGSATGGAALAGGGYPTLGLVLAMLFTAGALVQGLPVRRRRGRATLPEHLPREAAPARGL